MKTKLGTPCAPTWPTGWVDQVEAAEAELGHRICGAIGPDGAPCPMPSDHASGRCKYHGGSPCTGAQPGNKNSTKHGLYSRRLRICGSHCPKRHTCPSYDERLLEFPKTKWPTCPYEQEEYDNLTRSLLPQGQDHSPLYEHMVHTTALLSVMASRAAAVLSMHTLVTVTHVQFHDYSMESHKVSALLQAFLRLTSEHTKCVRELAKLSREGQAPAHPQPPATNNEDQREGACPHAPKMSINAAHIPVRPPTEHLKDQPELNDDPGDQENHREENEPWEGCANPKTRGCSPLPSPVEVDEQREDACPHAPKMSMNAADGDIRPPVEKKPEKLECTFSTTATKIKKSKPNKKKRKKKKRKKSK